MTNEEAIEYGNKWLQVNIDCECSRKIWIDCNTYEFFKTAIEALKQQTCEDAISRQVVLDKIKEVCFSKEQKWVDFRVSQGSNGERDFIINFIESLPSAQPKEKTGKWIKYGAPRCEEQHYQCTNCKWYVNFGQWGDVYTKQFKYCPNCKARMVSE